MRSHRHWGRGTLGLLLFFRGGGRGANVNVGRVERGGMVVSGWALVTHNICIYT